MTDDTKQILINRFKSFLWRAGAMVVVALVGFISDNLGLLHLSPVVVTIIGLVLGEITKFINQMNTVTT